MRKDRVTTPPISPTKAIDMMIPSENSRKGRKPEALIEEIRSCTFIEIRSFSRKGPILQYHDWVNQDRS